MNGGKNFSLFAKRKASQTIFCAHQFKMPNVHRVQNVRTVYTSENTQCDAHSENMDYERIYIGSCNCKNRVMDVQRTQQHYRAVVYIYTHTHTQFKVFLLTSGRRHMNHANCAHSTHSALLSLSRSILYTRMHSVHSVFLCPIATVTDCVVHSYANAPEVHIT